jgi:hypothetical protein
LTLLVSHPSKRDRRGDASAEQQHGNGGDLTETTRQYYGLLALIEIDEERRVRLPGHAHRDRRHGDMGDGRVGTVVQGDIGIGAGRHLRNAWDGLLQLEAGPAAGEGELAGLVVELVTEHAMPVVEIFEDPADMQRKGRAPEGVDQGARLAFC